MYKDFKQNKLDKELADKYTIDFRTVSQIRNGKRWQHLYDIHFTDVKPPKSVKLKKLTLDESLALLADLPYYRNYEIADKYNLDRSTISRIRSRKDWKSIWKIYDNRCATTIESTSNDGSE